MTSHIGKMSLFKSQPIKKIINSGGPILYNSLLRHKVKEVFIYSGGAIMPIIDSFYNSKIKTIVNTNELCTGLSAIGYSKSSNKIGVCLVTSGPGITNMITPLLDAKNDSTPLIVFSGQVPIAVEGTNAFQEAPAVELTKNVTKWSYKIEDINDLEYVIDEAFRVANTGKKGSVHIDIPKCVSYQQLTKSNINRRGLFQDNTYFNIKRNQSKIINIQFIKKVASIINNSKKPILYIGQGCKDSYKLLRILAIKANIPVTTTIHGNGIFDEHHALSLRWCGMHGYAPANYSLQEADTIIAIGSRFDDRTTGNLEHYAPNAFRSNVNGTGGIIHVNIENSEINFAINSHYNFNCDSGDFISEILPFIEYRDRFDWIQYTNNLKEKYPFIMKKSKTKNDKLHMEEVLDEIYNQTLDKDVMFTTGVGNHQMQTYQFIKSQYPNKIISSGSLGVMGAGLPYAIGSQLANPNKLIINIDGDSSFNMTLSDLKTVIEQKLPIKIAIMNNSSQMMVTIWEKLFFNERYTATLNENNPDYCKLAEAYGIKGLYCDNVFDLKNTINELINYKGPVLCEFKIKKDICLPLVGPSKALDDMILEANVEDQNIKLSGMAPS
jgi:acetolactate synthase-1/2/3 large subunit